MTFIESISSGGIKTRIAYQDLGHGRPVVLIHGWPLSHEMWEYQVSNLLSEGFRVIAYDRRGFGQSDKPAGPYDYDTLSDDLHTLIHVLELQDVTLVGFSMGGGEVIRYMSRHAGDRIRSIILLASIVPLLGQLPDHPQGVPTHLFGTFEKALGSDRPAFIEQFGKACFGVGLLKHPVSEAFLDWIFMLAMKASPLATIACMHAYAETDFRTELNHVKLPCLIIHGDADKTVPIESTSALAAQMIPHATYLVYEGAPHGLFFTDQDRLNADLCNFLKA